MADLKGKTVAVIGGTNTMQKITALNKQMNPDLSVINGKDHGKWFVQPIPPSNMVLSCPLGDQLARVIAKPNASGDRQDYK